MNAAMRAWIGLGANLGDPADALSRALSVIDALPQVRLKCASSLYRSAPVAAGGPDFVNAAAELATTHTPQALLDHLLGVEKAFGRERLSRNAPRTLDLDLLLACDAAGPIRIDTPSLTLPHPRLHQRAFVLVPLIEIAPDLEVPGHGRLADLLAACADQRVERIGPILR